MTERGTSTARTGAAYSRTSAVMPDGMRQIRVRQRNLDREGAGLGRGLACDQPHRALHLGAVDQPHPGLGADGDASQGPAR